MLPPFIPVLRTGIHFSLALLIIAVPAVFAESVVEKPVYIESVDENNNELLPPRFLADLRVRSPQELADILSRVDTLLNDGGLQPGESDPIVFLMHGDEAKILFKGRYNENKSVVDLAAKLSAFNVVDIKVCETWLQRNQFDKANMQPFVGFVPFAPVEEKRLLEKESYQYF